MERNEKADIVLENIKTRMSVRRYERRSVDMSLVEKMLQAAMAAPSACNKQPCRYLVIREHGTLKKLADAIPSMSMAGDAPLAILVAGDSTAFLPDEAREYFAQDAAAATQNLMLEAHALGLGSVWCGIYPLKKRCEEVSDMLKLPENIVPFSLVVIGYAADEHNPKDKWHNEYVHIEKW